MKRCFQYTEIRTKITSLFPFAMSLALLFYRRQTIRWGATAVFFASMFLFDLTTTAINNYIDSKSTQQQLAYRRRTALIVIWALFFISAALGLYLVVLTDIVVLLTGALCFACGVFYTYGPVPISRQPLGEILSGVFYGFFIPFLILYINMPAGALLRIQVDGQTLTAAVQIRAMLELLLLSSIPTFTTANIMLANNICDLQRGHQNGPIYAALLSWQEIPDAFCRVVLPLLFGHARLGRFWHAAGALPPVVAYASVGAEEHTEVFSRAAEGNHLWHIHTQLHSHQRFGCGCDTAQRAFIIE